MSAGSPFLVIPWQEDFLQQLLRLALDDTGGDIGRAVFLFPHARPQRYLIRLLREEPRVRRPLVLPRMHTINGLLTACRARIRPQPLWNAGLLDRVGLLFECLRQESCDLAPHEQLLPYAHDARRFFPWGRRLAALFEECFSQRVSPQNFPHAEGQVSPFAVLLLACLKGLFGRYVAGLDANAWTSPGYDAFITANAIAGGRALPAELTGRGPMYIAGFHALSGTEDTLLRHLWSEHGARVVLHADARLCADGPARREAHWSCSALRDWAGQWGASLTLPDGVQAAPAPAADITYCQGFDLHSQLAELQKELAALPGLSVTEEESSAPATDMPSGSALVPAPAPAPVQTPVQAPDPAQDPRDKAGETLLLLPDSGLLLPVLHHLPPVDINISMGYSLTRSPLFRLIDSIFKAQEQRRGRTYYWRDLIDLIRHPYLKMLRPGEEEQTPPPDAPADEAPLRREMHRLEQALRKQGRAYIDPELLLEEVYTLLPAEELPPQPVLRLMDDLFSVILRGFAELTSPHTAGMALARLCQLLLYSGGHIWNRFLIDAECLYRLRQSLIPELTESRLAGETFTPETLFSIIRALMHEERVPFDASPLVGLQVMGMLETRLLSFKRVCIIDAVDGKLPGAPASDPLLPESLRADLGLPPLHAREQVAAYHFFRLLAGARQATLYWQEGEDAPGIQEQRTLKSRFIEELLWEEEKRRGRILRASAGPNEQPGDQPDDQPGGAPPVLRRLGSTVAPIRKSAKGVRIESAQRDLLRALMSGPVSASLLDSYLRCPVQFYYERAARLVPAETVREGEDPLAVGNLFHTVLQECYAPHMGRALPGGQELASLMREDLLAALQANPAYAERAEALPADSFATFSLAAKKRLSSYLSAQPPCTVLALETPLSCELTVKDSTFSLYGRADRIDLRPAAPPFAGGDEGIVILDYKTGEPPKMLASFWENASLWDRMAVWSPGRQVRDANGADALLVDLHRHLESVQLPLYLLLFAQAAESRSLAPDLAAHAGTPLRNACWVCLGNTGEELPLYPDDGEEGQRRRSMEQQLPLLVSFLLGHMLESPEYFPKPGAYCRWCSCAKLCIVPRVV